MHVDARSLPPAAAAAETPILDLEEMRAAEDQILEQLRLGGSPEGMVRIPIARAIDLLAQRGLPSRPQAAPESASDASVPTESGLGPKMIAARRAAGAVSASQIRSRRATDELGVAGARARGASRVSPC